MKQIFIDENQIGSNGAKFLAQMLQKNTVIKHVFCIEFSLFLFLYVQVIEEITIANNQIKDDGAQYLAEVLRNNTVIFIHMSYPLNYLF